MVMEKEQIPINFESVANFAKVSKTTLYADGAIKAQIKKAREMIDNNQLTKLDKLAVATVGNETRVHEKYYIVEFLLYFLKTVSMKLKKYSNMYI
jgi:hypothetical protein